MQSTDRRYLLLNLKGYAESFADASLAIAGFAREVSIETGINVIVCPPTPWLHHASSTGAVVYAQHTDPVEPGATTGYHSLEMLKAAGAAGTLLNHSEHRLGLWEMQFLVERGRKIGMRTVACADTARTAAAVSVLCPDMVAIEPPELIGKGVSVSKARPEVITESVDAIRKVNSTAIIIAGAGVTTADDVSKAVELGAEGALVASAVVKSDRQRKLIAEMADALLV